MGRVLAGREEKVGDEPVQRLAHHGHKRRPRAPKPFEEADVVDQRDTGLVVVAVDVVGSKHTFQQRSGQRRVALASESPENAPLSFV